jgi:hypothetical protein
VIPGQRSKSASKLMIRVIRWRCTVDRQHIVYEVEKDL